MITPSHGHIGRDSSTRKHMGFIIGPDGSKLDVWSFTVTSVGIDPDEEYATLTDLTSDLYNGFSYVPDTGVTE